MCWHMCMKISCQNYKRQAILPYISYVCELHMSMSVCGCVCVLKGGGVGGWYIWQYLVCSFGFSS